MKLKTPRATILGTYSYCRNYGTVGPTVFKIRLECACSSKMSSPFISTLVAASQVESKEEEPRGVTRTVRCSDRAGPPTLSILSKRVRCGRTGFHDVR